MIALGQLTPAAEEAWWVLFDLTDADSENWALIGGQMVQVLASEYDATELVRPTEDVDVVVDTRARRGGTEWLAGWLTDRGFELGGVSPDSIGHRYVRSTEAGIGRLAFDVLAPEGLSARTPSVTTPPARTVQVPGATQALQRSKVVEVTVSGVLNRPERKGRVRRPDLLGAIIVKAAAHEIPVRDNPDRDWQDAALLLSMVVDPNELADQCTRKDKRRLIRLRELDDREHVGWGRLDDERYRLGTAALDLLLSR
jgi:hypothetical protein